MDSISEIGSGSTGGTAGIDGTKPDLDKEAFLQLLVTQLRYQDPFSPMNNEDFIAQLTQFSSLENLQNIYQELNTTSLLQQSTHNALSTSLIGKYSLIGEATVTVDGDYMSSAVYILPQQGDVKIEITDDSGATVRTILRMGLQDGEHLLLWDGKDDAGNEVPDGTYSIKVEYTSMGGEDVSIPVCRAGRISAVRFWDGSPIIMIGGEEYRLSDILEVMESLPEE